MPKSSLERGETVGATVGMLKGRSRTVGMIGATARLLGGVKRRSSDCWGDVKRRSNDGWGGKRRTENMSALVILASSNPALTSPPT
eukprot:3548686-Rhodomonas_salina.2